MSRVATRGLTFNAHVAGPSGAPWLILANSLGSTGQMWDDQIPVLTKRYRVLRYDHRGHGGTDVPDGVYTFDLHVQDVIDLMDAFGIEKASFMGLSMGAMTGMGLAIDHGERFDKMVLCDGRADAPPPFVENWDNRIGIVNDGGLEAIAEMTTNLWFNDAFREANPDRVAVIQAMVTSHDPKGYIACCEGLKTLDYLKGLGRISIPVTYVCGSLDKGAPSDAMRAMSEATPGSRFIEIEGGAHLPNIDSAAAFNDAIAEPLEL